MSTWQFQAGLKEADMASDIRAFEKKNDAEAFIEKLIEDTNAERIEWVSCGDDVYDIPDVRLVHVGILKLVKEGILYTGRPGTQGACAQGDVRLLTGSIAASLDFYEGKDLVVIPHRSAAARAAADDAAQNLEYVHADVAQGFEDVHAENAQDFDCFLIWEDEEGSHKTLLLTTSGDETGTLRRLMKKLYGIIFNQEEAGPCAETA